MPTEASRASTSSAASRRSSTTSGSSSETRKKRLKKRSTTKRIVSFNERFRRDSVNFPERGKRKSDVETCYSKSYKQLAAILLPAEQRFSSTTEPLGPPIDLGSSANEENLPPSVSSTAPHVEINESENTTFEKPGSYTSLPIIEPRKRKHFGFSRKSKKSAPTARQVAVQEQQSCCAAPVEPSCNDNRSPYPDAEYYSMPQQQGCSVGSKALMEETYGPPEKKRKIKENKHRGFWCVSRPKKSEAYPMPIDDTDTLQPEEEDVASDLDRARSSHQYVQPEEEDDARDLDDHPSGSFNEIELGAYKMSRSEEQDAAPPPNEPEPQLIMSVKSVLKQPKRVWKEDVDKVEIKVKPKRDHRPRKKKRKKVKVKPKSPEIAEEPEVLDAHLRTHYRLDQLSGDTDESLDPFKKSKDDRHSPRGKRNVTEEHKPPGQEAHERTHRKLDHTESESDVSLGAKTKGRKSRRGRRQSPEDKKPPSHDVHERTHRRLDHADSESDASSDAKTKGEKKRHSPHGRRQSPEDRKPPSHDVHDRTHRKLDHADSESDASSDGKTKGKKKRRSPYGRRRYSAEYIRPPSHDVHERTHRRLDHADSASDASSDGKTNGRKSGRYPHGRSGLEEDTPIGQDAHKRTHFRLDHVWPDWGGKSDTKIKGKEEEQSQQSPRDMEKQKREDSTKRAPDDAGDKREKKKKHDKKRPKTPGLSARAPVQKNDKDTPPGENKESTQRDGDKAGKTKPNRPRRTTPIDMSRVPMDKQEKKEPSQGENDASRASRDRPYKTKTDRDRRGVPVSIPKEIMDKQERKSSFRGSSDNNTVRSKRESDKSQLSMAFDKSQRALPSRTGIAKPQSISSSKLRQIKSLFKLSGNPPIINEDPYSAVEEKDSSDNDDYDSDLDEKFIASYAPIDGEDEDKGEERRLSGQKNIRISLETPEVSPDSERTKGTRDEKKWIASENTLFRAPLWFRRRMEENDYDPYKHRSVVNPSPNMETMLHIIKCCTGIGILTMPYGFMYAGLFNGVICTIFMMSFTTYCANMLIKCQMLICKRNRIPMLSYPDTLVAALTVGPRFLRKIARRSGIFLECIIIINQMLICTVYSLFIATNLKSVLDSYIDTGDAQGLSVDFYLMGLLILLIAISMFRTIKAHANLALIGNCGTFYSMSVIFFYIFRDLPSIQDRELVADPAQFPIFFGTTMFIFDSISNIIAIENNMQTPTSFGGFFGIFNLSMMFFTLIVTLVGYFGYWKYGDSVLPVVTLNLPPARLANMAKVVFAASLLLSYGMHCYIPVKFLTRRVKHSPHPVLWDIFLRVGCAVLPVMVAAFVPKLRIMVPLFGSLCGPCLKFLVPATIEFCLKYSDGLAYGCWMVIIDVLTFGFGVCGMILGIYCSLWLLSAADFV